MTSESVAAETLKVGIDILTEYMSRHSFSPSTIDTSAGSGGFSAVGEFRGGDRRLVLHFRYSLGLVTYVVGDSVFSHAEYMKALDANGCKYPGFSGDPLDGSVTY